MNHHYRSPHPIHHTPPPPPPPPPEVLADDVSAGSPPRCYFCGHAIAENEVRKTDYHVGHGHNIMVMICPACQQMKDRGEGPFAQRISGQAVFGIIMLGVFVLFVLAAWLPGYLDMKKRHAVFEKQFEQGVKERENFRKKFDQEWNRDRPGF